MLLSWKKDKSPMFGMEDKIFVFALNMTKARTDKQTVWNLRQTFSVLLTQSGQIHTGMEMLS